MSNTKIQIIFEAEEFPKEGLWVNIMTQNEDARTIRHECLLSCPFKQAQTLANNLNGSSPGNKALISQNEELM